MMRAQVGREVCVEDLLDRWPSPSEREGVEQVHEDVPGVREEAHALSAAERSQRPSTVNITMTTSMTTCERAAARELP